MNNKIKTYRDLIVWQKSMALVTNLYFSTKNFPQHEQFSLTSQIRRFCISIPSNIAEGYGRNSKNDYIRFLNITMGSLFEFQTQLEVATNLEYLSPDNYKILYDQS